MLGIRKKVVPIRVLNERVGFDKERRCLIRASLGCTVVVLVTKQVTAGGDGRTEKV